MEKIVSAPPSVLAQSALVPSNRLVPPTPARFWDRRADSYAKKPVPDEDAYARTLERVRAHLSPDDEVLELGCGTGTTALKLAASARTILATDYSARMIAIAQQKAETVEVGNVHFRRADSDDVTLVRESFDVVTAMNLLHLIDDLPAFAQRVRQLVRPGGVRGDAQTSPDADSTTS